MGKIIATRASGLSRYQKFVASFRSTGASFFKSRLHRSSIMAEKSKSETEWRAILSPEQVRLFDQPVVTLSIR